MKIHKDAKDMITEELVKDESNFESTVECASEYWSAMALLDKYDIPEKLGHRKLSLVGRINYLTQFTAFATAFTVKLDGIG